MSKKNRAISKMAETLLSDLEQNSFFIELQERCQFLDKNFSTWIYRCILI